MPDPHVALIRYDAARKALAEARTVDDAKAILNKAEALRAYARMANDGQLLADATEIRVRAERRVGEMMEAQKETVGLHKGGRPSRKTGVAEPPVSVPTLSDAGIDKELAKAARTLARLPEERFEQRIEQMRERILSESRPTSLDALRNGAHVGQNSGESEWYTPAEYADAAREAMGGIDLDPASCAKANEVVKATKFFSTKDDGLSKPWKGRIFLNPPYMQPAVADFCERTAALFGDGSISQAVVLVNNATETAHCQRLLVASSATCFPRGRIRFWHPERESATPLQGQMLCYFGNAIAAFEESFSKFGCVLFRAR